MYGALPADLGRIPLHCDEMMSYVYLPVKLSGAPTVEEIHIEPRLNWLKSLVGVCCCDYVAVRGLDEFVASHVYVTAKHGWEKPGCPLNRPGWHSDGFGTDDINYIWYDCNPTVFNSSRFRLSQDDSKSLKEMADQADIDNNIMFPVEHLLRLDQYVIHRAANVHDPRLRTFVKISFSRDKYNLVGNSKNYLMPYSWEMRPRKLERNVPQDLSKTGN